MHSEAFEFVARHATDQPISVIEIGSRDINGTARSLFHAASWIGLDLYPGPCVDWVGDAAKYQPKELVDLVMCMETLEHASNWIALIHAGVAWLKIGGEMIITCAGPGREEHSAIDGGPCYAGEYYANLSTAQIDAAIAGTDADSWDSFQSGNDTYAVVIR